MRRLTFRTSNERVLAVMDGLRKDNKSLFVEEALLAFLGSKKGRSLLAVLNINSCRGNGKEKAKTFRETADNKNGKTKKANPAKDVFFGKRPFSSVEGKDENPQGVFGQKPVGAEKAPAGKEKKLAVETKEQNPIAPLPVTEDLPVVPTQAVTGSDPARFLEDFWGD